MPAVKKTLWRRLLISLLILLLLALLTLATLAQVLRQQLDIQQLSFDGLSLRWGKLHIEQLDIKLGQAATQQLKLSDLQLHWQGFALSDLTIANLHYQHLAAQTETPETQTSGLTSLAPQDLIPNWLPPRIKIQQFTLEIPCPNSNCLLSGDLLFDRLAKNALHIQLTAPTGTLLLLGSLSPQTLQLQLQNQQQTLLQLNSHWDSQTKQNHWHTALQAHISGPQPELDYYLKPWSSNALNLAQNPLSLILKAQWQLQLSKGPLNLERLLGAQGQLNLDLQLPNPWPIPQLGALQGQALVELQSGPDSWQAKNIKLALSLHELSENWRQHLPKPMDLGILGLQLQAQSERIDQLTHPISLSLNSTGPSQLSASAQLNIQRQAGQWNIEIDELRASLNTPRLDVDQLRLLNISAQLNARASLSSHEQTLTLFSGSTLKAQQLNWPEQQLSSASFTANLQGLQLEQQVGTALKLQAPLQLSIDQLRQPQLKARTWQLNGQLKLANEALQIRSQLSHDRGYKTPLSLDFQANKGLSLRLSPVTFPLSEHNPLADTFADWPALLEFSTGQSTLGGDLHWQNDQLTAHASLNLQRANGIYDTAEISGLDANLEAQIAQDKLTLHLSSLTLEQLNPGLALQNIQLNAHYLATLKQPLQGQLSWQPLQAELLEGSLSMEAGELHFGKENSSHSLKLQGLNLQQLLASYPTEGLFGNGLIDGQLPVLISPTGFSIKDGKVSARAPGGQLRFSNAKLKALGQNNPAMSIVVLALQNFNYHVLQSSVDYTEQGKLHLGLTLQGFSPDVEKGRAINFNINLEEDIPALLTSLQLSGKVSEKIQQRMQERMHSSPPSSR